MEYLQTAVKTLFIFFAVLIGSAWLLTNLPTALIVIPLVLLLWAFWPKQAAR